MSTNAREQINTENSYIDAEPVYGSSTSRLEWLRDGPVDGNMANNQRHADAAGRLPAASGRPWQPRVRAHHGGRRPAAGRPELGPVAGDVRANENIALTATHTLFAREHNRIVAPAAGNGLSEEDKFQIARRVVVAEQQYITYNEFLPAVGVNLPAYTGYNPNVNADAQQRVRDRRLPRPQHDPR